MRAVDEVGLPLPPSIRRRVQVPARRAVPVIIGASAIVAGLLLWLVYGIGADDGTSSSSPLLLVNAGLNAAAAVCLLAGWHFVRADRLRAHRNAMLSGVACSAAFLVGYLVNHARHGDAAFGADGWLALVYGVLLVSHIVMSILALPFIATTVWAAASSRWATHRRVARITLPVWLYVSATGVVVALLLRFAG